MRYKYFNIKIKTIKFSYGISWSQWKTSPLLKRRIKGMEGHIIAMKSNVFQSQVRAYTGHINKMDIYLIALFIRKTTFTLSPWGWFDHYHLNWIEISNLDLSLHRLHFPTSLAIWANVLLVPFYRCIPL